jgi:hypothetical protein
VTGHLQVTAGNPTPEELATVLVVLTALAAGPGEPPRRASRAPGGLRAPLAAGPWRRGARL